MDFFARAQTSLLSWMHETPLPSVQTSAKFQSWHTYDIRQGWVPASSPNTENPAKPHSGRDTSHLVLLTWNIDATSPRTEERVTNIITTITGLDPSVDIIFLQEVSRPALQQILKDEHIRENWLSSECDDVAWGKQSFATMTLLSKTHFASAHVGPIWRAQFPSHFARDALCCDIFVPAPDKPTAAATRIRLVNVHLDSLPIKPSLRPRQLSIVSSFLRVAGQGLVAGDFNPVLDEDSDIIERNGLVDVWSSFRPGEPGYTWGLDGKQPFPPNRLDKIGILGLRCHSVKTLEPAQLNESSGDVPLSDHHAVVCSFGLSGQ
ncbi:endonuclease/exonuclease/phosphatase family protein [Penicillium capsulatum]|uniref:Endonuclease/exonuclease/phosphatase family protein n=1 Tax=Penicillium capsulatum TaxID=69766 RepID=A0A9W9LW13_9EURO|nr:endonuclease/exonuclease/phosphatase family protein [Penicillium capsulatum]KAJ6123294.1 endonuclease/exonuclease/phosphatase family protein [Penicillium capsulatum]